MSLVPMRWLIELRDGSRPVGLYLHAFEGDARTDAGTEWEADATRALRFPTKATADEYIRAEIDHDAVASPFTADELVAPMHHVFESEVLHLAAC